MSTLVLSNDALNVGLSGQHLEITRQSAGRAELSTVPLFDLERICVYGHPNLTLPVLGKLLSLHIPVSFHSYHGKWLGSLTSGDGGDANRRLKQYGLLHSPHRLVRWQSLLIHAKIRNARRFLQRLAGAREQATDPAQQDVNASLLKRMLELKHKPHETESIRGIEGVAAAVYFRRLGDFFPADCPFEERSRRPPRNAANALMSWNYALVLSEVQTSIRKQGLDPALGILHTVEANTPSLALDLLEPFRAPIADALTLHLLNHRLIRPEHFELNPENGGTYLTNAGKPVIVNAYEQAMTREFKVRRDLSPMTFRQAIDRQTQSFCQALLHDSEPQFFFMP